MLSTGLVWVLGVSGGYACLHLCMFEVDAGCIHARKREGTNRVLNYVRTGCCAGVCLRAYVCVCVCVCVFR